MSTKNRMVVLLSMMVVLALSAACGAPEPTATMVPTSEPPVIPTDTPSAPAEADAAITVTFDGDTCVFHGPERVPAGRIPVVLDVRDQTAHESYGVQILTMDEGRTIEEVVAYQEEISLPLWAHDHGFIIAAQGTAQEQTIVLFEGPLFLTCFTNTADETQAKYVGISGPIEIEPVAVFPKGTFTAKDGDWALTFDDDGSFTFSESGTVAASGTFSIQANELTWETDSYCDRAGKATYTWTFEKDTLLFQVKGEDECADRLAVLDSILYHKTMAPTSELPVAPTDTPPASADANSEITVTFEGDQCVYHGPESLPAGRIPIVLDVRDQTAYEWYGVGAATVDEGKTLDDLVAAPFDSHAPDWVHDQAFAEAAQGDSQETTLTLFEGPLFLVCATSDGKTNVLGPIEIEPLKKKAEPTTAAESGDSTWNLVVLGDSLVAEDYSVLPEAYAAYLEEDLGVEVEIQNLAVGGETSRSLLANVQKYPWYREPLQEAEVVLISVGGGDLPGMEKRFFGGECGGADNQDCLRQQLEESKANWDALLAEIASLADPGETLIRPIIPGILEYYARVYKDQPGDVEVYNSYVVALYEHMARSCAERGIPVLDLYALYDGPNADPGLPELAGTGDGVHVSKEGDAVIAELLRELGYAPISLVTNAEALAGVWHRTTPDSSGGEVYREYTADGIYRMGRSPEELEDQPRVEGEFWFEGDQMVMRDVTALPSYDLCLQAGQVGRYTVERLANGHIRFVEVEDPCPDRARMLGTGEMEPVR